MTVEDHPLYKEWAAALDHLVEARERFNAAERTGKAVLVNLARRDLEAAQDAYDSISDRIE